MVLHILRRLFFQPIIRWWRLLHLVCPYCTRPLRRGWVTSTIDGGKHTSRFEQICPQMHFARRYLSGPSGLEAETIDGGGRSLTNIYRATLS